MAQVKYTPQELVEVWFVASITAPTGPSAAEINAGTRLTPFLIDGPPTPAGSNFAAAGTLESGFESQVPSTYGGGSGTMTVIRKRDTTTQDATADTAYAALPRGTTGYIVVAPYGVSGSNGQVGVGDVVSVYSIEVANRGQTISRGELMSSPIDVAFNDLPNENVTCIA